MALQNIIQGYKNFQKDYFDKQRERAIKPFVKKLGKNHKF